MKSFKRSALMFLPIAVIGIFMSVFLFISYSDAGISVDGKLRVAPLADTVDNVAGATDKSWVFTVTTTAEMAEGDVFRFILPSTTVGAPFAIVNPSSTAMSGLTLYKNLGPTPVFGVSSTMLVESGVTAFYGYISTTTASNTPFSVTVRGVNNAEIATSSLLWTVEGGT